MVSGARLGHGSNGVREPLRKRRGAARQDHRQSVSAAQACFAGPHRRLSAERLNVQEVARQAGVSRPAVWRWQQRYGEEGVDGLLRDKTRPPGTPAVPQARVQAVFERTLRAPPGAVTHWTGRAMV